VKSTNNTNQNTYTTTAFESYKNLTHLAEKHYFSTHNSSRNPIKKSLTITLYKELKDEKNTPYMRVQKSDLDQKQIAHTMTTPSTKP